MSVKVYRIKIEGYVTDTDFGGDTVTTPADWAIEQIVGAMGVSLTVTETLLDTIEDEDEA